MKYSEKNKPMVCMMKNSTCYQGTEPMKVKGILWHSTGANNPSLKRYVQPHEDDANYDEMIQILGKNKYGNDWNHIKRSAGLNAWIGKLPNGEVTTVQTMPWNYAPWGCGKGSKGSCNGSHVQFEICEDGLSDKTYFNKVYKEACELTAYLCEMYDLDPLGTVKVNNVVVPTILCHADAYKLKLGSNHGDVLYWFKKHGKTMDDVRKDVAELLKGNVNKTVESNPVTSATAKKDSDINKGDIVKLASNAVYHSGKTVPSWVKNTQWIVKSVDGSRAVIDKSADGKNAINSAIDVKYLTAVEEASTAFKSYKVQITTSALNIRSGAGTTYKVTGCIKDKNDGLYTIVAEKNGFGKLDNGKGWICLEYTKKVTTSPVKYKITTSGGVNMRKGAGTIYGKVAAIPYNTTVTVTETKSGWGKTTYGGKTGWFSLNYAKKV